jgi:hypothetical protein
MLPSNISSSPQAARPKLRRTARRRRPRPWRRIRRLLPPLLHGVGRVSELLWNVAVALYLGSIGLFVLILVIGFLGVAIYSLLGH